MKDISNNKQIFRNLVFNTLSFILNFIISFCFTPYLIRVVGKEAYSFFSLINNMIGYTAIITTAVGSMAGRFITMRIYKDDLEDANRYLNAMWVSNLVLSVFFTFLSIVLVVYIDQILTVPLYLLSDVRWLFGLGVFSMILGLLTGYLSIPTYVRNRVDLSSISHAAVSIVRLIAILLLFYFLKPSIVFMSLSALLAAFVGIAINYQFKKKLLPELTIAPKKYFNLSYVKTLTSSGVWNSVSQLSNTLLYQLDLFITNIFISAAVTGDYAIAKTAPTLILQLLAMLSGTFVSHFNVLYAKGQVDMVVAESRKSMVIVGMLIGLPIGFLAIFSDVFYDLWVPGQDSQFLYWLTLFSVIPMVLGGSINPIFGIFTTTNKLKVPSLVVLGAGIIQVIVIVLLLKTTSLGIWAIVFTSLAQSVLRNSIFTPIYGAYVLGKKWYTFYPTILRGIAGVCVVIALGYGYRRIFPVDSWLAFFIAGAVVCGIALFVNSYVMLSKDERGRIFEIVLKIIPTRKLKSLFKWFVLLVIVLMTVLLTIPSFYYNGKTVHLSFDDCYVCLKELSSESTKYNSVFEQPFFAELKDFHKKTGAKFTLYIYEEANGFDITQFPAKYARELNNNSDWLKIGYHAKNPTITKDSIAIYQVFTESFSKVDSVLTAKSLRDGKSSTIRLHFFFATQKEIEYLTKHGIKTLLSADDERVSYSLSEEDNSILMQDETLTKNGLKYLSTDLRVERDNAILGLWKNLNDEELVLFTHEWAYSKPYIKWKYKLLIRLLSIYKCNFIC